MIFRLFTFCLFFLVSFSAFPQSKKQKELEQRRKNLLEQIKLMTDLRTKQAQERKSVTAQIQEITEKIQAREEFIRLTNEQANLLNYEISQNQNQIKNLQKDLSDLQQEYAVVIRQSYKNRSPEHRLLLILSSETLSQGYKRLKYIEQYTNFRKKQTIKIRQKNDTLHKINSDLLQKRKQKERILLENETEKFKLGKEKQEQEVLVQKIQKKEEQYAQQIKKKQQQAKDLDKEIDRLVRLAIIEANKKAKAVKKIVASRKTKSSGKKEVQNDATIIELTEDTKSISDNFQSQKGKLIWPVAKGYKAQGFGTYSDPVYPDVKHNNSGVTISTQKNMQARCIFDGEVSAIIAIPGGNKAVQVRHGNFISIYYNLLDVSVVKGQAVKEKTPLGTIFTDSEGKTEMKFFLYKNTTKLNPEYWISGM